MNYDAMLARIRLSQRRVAMLLLACTLPGAAHAADNVAAELQELRNRIDALEAQLKSQQAAPAPAVAASAGNAAAAPAAVAPANDFKLAWGGYVKLDVLGSRFTDGAVAQSTGRDFYVPNAIPVAATENGRDYLDFSAKETRLFLKGDGAVYGHKIGAYVEFDFISGQIAQSTGGAGNEAVTNAYNPALRRAYITFDNLLAGQDWSTFQNIVALPDTLDFVAWPSDGTVFIRQPQLRYTIGGLSVALENPETTVAVRGGGTFANADDNSLPDLVSRYTLKTGLGDFSLAGIVRQLADRGSVTAPAATPPAVTPTRGNDTSVGYGLSLAGKIPLFARDDIRFTLTAGDGIGRYQALNTVGDAVLDANGKLHTIEVINGFIAYRHPWTEKLRSTFVLSAYHANTGKLGSSDLAASVTRRVESASMNLLYSPIPNLTFGSEFRYAKRDVVGDLSGALERLQLSAKYSF